MIGAADRLIVLEHAAKRRQRQRDAPVLRKIRQPDFENQAIFGCFQHQTVGAARRSFWPEQIAFENIVDCNTGFPARFRRLVFHAVRQLDGHDPVFGICLGVDGPCPFSNPQSLTTVETDGNGMAVRRETFCLG